jgi:hypothetical protein
LESGSEIGKRIDIIGKRIEYIFGNFWKIDFGKLVLISIFELNV